MWLLLIAFNALFIGAGVYLVQNSYYELGAILFIASFLIDLFIINPRAYPYRYTIPALIFLLLLVVYPICFTIKTAFTNYGTGHIFTRQEAVERLLYDPNYTYAESEEAIGFKVFSVFEDSKPTDDFILLFDINGELYLGDVPSPSKQRGKEILLREGKTYKVTSEEVSVDGKVFKLSPFPESLENINMIVSADKEYKSLYALDDPALQKNTYHFIMLVQKYLANAEYLNQDQGKIIGIRVDTDGKWKFFFVERLYRLAYREIEEDGKVSQKMVIVNTRTNEPLIEDKGSFYDIDENGNQVFLIGYTAWVGLENFLRIFTDKRISGPFMNIFVWTIMWSLFSVLLSFLIGLVFALALNNERLRGRNVYRTLLIIPWAVPYFISVLTWKNGILNETYGILNKIILPFLGLDPVKWFNDQYWAKLACIIVNTWLTFPYMMTISLGALQSIPDELYEVAAIDGAGKWQNFRHITFPLLLTVVAPLLISSFAFTFNNFTLIYLLNSGGPPMVGATTPAGHTDILISYVYKLAFEGRGQEFGFASAISVIIFVLVGGISLLNFKISGAFEEIRNE
ncbi:MAG TPA: ABC transporter permease subunit [Candidatus Atribacteria bacterium]|nr:ABC transporter permease subunit [Atribacterota bacterium]HOA99374.1 ABC transporter permease subunit [Candidatus Atribacteria bacterium]MDI9607993.1 ABC transporter permease subunit [Atribacterota bacterium]HOQ51180.1 ABC transporter permease subunit [Candidatus Atribacteria bacterium]HPT63249.1 ABC transporter permease subunit [Candidatus Atribacteria bacterium]